MITTIIDVVRKRGDNYAIRFQTKQNGAVMNITGATFKLTVNAQPKPLDATVPPQVFQVAGNIIDAPNGIYEFVPTTGQMNQTPGKYYYDVEMTLSGQVATLVAGKFTIQQDITK